MNDDRARRAQLCIGLLAGAAGLVAMMYSGLDLSGPGDGALLSGDSYFVSSLFRLNALGGLALLAAGVLGVLASRRGPVALAGLGSAIALIGAVVVLVGVGDDETLVGAGNPSNAAVFLTVAVGLAVTEWAAGAAAETSPG